MPYGRALISRVAARWRKHYFDGAQWGRTLQGSAEEVYLKLRALPATATERDVAYIIGNETWVGHLCVECYDYKQHAIEFGSENAIVCSDCIRDAAAMLGQPETVDAVDPQGGSTPDRPRA